MYTPPYVRRLSGHPGHRIGSQPSVSNIRNSDDVLATSLVGMPPPPIPQNLPMVASGPCAPPPDVQNSLVASQSSLTFHDGHQHIPSPDIPQAYPWHYTPTPQPLNYAENQVPMPPVDSPQIYPQLCIPSSQSLGCAEVPAPMPPLFAPQESSYLPCHVPAAYTTTFPPLGYAGGQVPMPPLGAPQSYPQLCQPSLQSLYAGEMVTMPPLCAPQSYPQLCTSSSPLLDLAEDLVPMSPLDAPHSHPQLCTPSSQLPDCVQDQVPIQQLGAPQGSPCPTGPPIENSASASGHSFQNQETSTDPSPLAPESKRMTKRKRKVSLSADNDGKRPNPVVSTDAAIPDQSTPRKRKKADYDPQKCPYCHDWITRPRRFRKHVRDRCLVKAISKHEISETAIGQAIKKWGIPETILINSFNIMDIKAQGLKKYAETLRGRLQELIRGTSDEGVVEVLVTSGVPVTTFRDDNLKTNTDQGSTSKVKPSPTLSVQEAGANGSKIATEHLMPSETRTPTPCLSETYDSSSNLSFPSYFLGTSTNPAGMPSSAAVTQAPSKNSGQFSFGQGTTASFSFGQNGTHAARLESNLAAGALPPPQSEPRALGSSTDSSPPVTEDPYERFADVPDTIRDFFSQLLSTTV